MKKQWLLVIPVIAAIMVTLLLAGCAAGPNPTLNTVDAAGKTAGFWSGLWH